MADLVGYALAGQIATITIDDGKVNAQCGMLRRFKDDVREVAAGYECGISIEACMFTFTPGYMTSSVEAKVPDSSRLSTRSSSASAATSEAGINT